VSPTFDENFYNGLLAKRSHFDLKEKFTVLPENGKGFVVKKGQAFRVLEAEGPQIGDLWFYNRNNPKEHFWSNYTMVLEGVHMKKLSRLWSEMPEFRPMATVLEETVSTRGAHPHNIALGSHCTTESWELLSGMKGHNSCYMNGLQAVSPFGLGERDLHDNLNIHMKVMIDGKTGIVSVDKTECEKGDYIEFYAEIDLLVALSVCPLGDGSFLKSVTDKIIVRPLEVEIYDTYVEPKPFPKWSDWRPSFHNKISGLARDKDAQSKKIVCPECREEVEVIPENTAIRPGIDNAVLICSNEKCKRYKKPFSIGYAL
jgi:uncharacterized protein YcgI (DUF1989 family)